MVRNILELNSESFLELKQAENGWTQIWLSHRGAKVELGGSTSSWDSIALKKCVPVALATGSRILYNQYCPHCRRFLAQGDTEKTASVPSPCIAHR